MISACGFCSDGTCATSANRTRFDCSSTIHSMVPVCASRLRYCPSCWVVSSVRLRFRRYSFTRVVCSFWITAGAVCASLLVFLGQISRPLVPGPPVDSFDSSFCFALAMYWRFPSLFQRCCIFLVLFLSHRFPWLRLWQRASFRCMTQGDAAENSPTKVSSESNESRRKKCCFAS